MCLSAIIGGALSVGGSLLSSDSQGDAAETAADAQVQASRENAELMREIYGRNEGNLSPFMARGNAAGDAINALLGIGGGTTATMQQPSSGFGYGIADGQAGLGTPGIGNGGFRNFGINDLPGIEDRPAFQRANALSPERQERIANRNARNAFADYRDSTGYRFRLNQGMNALNSGYAGAGVLQSGAAMQDAVRFGQDFASGEFGNYLGHLGNQQAVGAGAASSLAGVGQNFANSMAQNNNDRAGAIGNAALIRGNNNPFANALGMLGGGLFQYGMGD